MEREGNSTPCAPGQSRISNQFIPAVGSIPLARKAGIKPADPAAKARTTAEPMNVNGSRGSNPKSWLRIRLARANAGEKPAARPAPMRMNTSRMTIAITLLRNAPSAMRIPISRVSPHHNVSHDPVKPDDGEQSGKSAE
jgi:hypothetical protein